MGGKNNLIKYFLLISFSLIAVSCNDPSSSPEDIPISELLSAPESITVDNKVLILDTSIGLNLQPMVSKTPMIAFAFIETKDSSNISQNINAKYIYIVNQNDLWKSQFTSEERPEHEMKPYRIIEVARDGPYWGPEIYVDVIVSLEINNKSYFLRASNQFIEASY